MSLSLATLEEVRRFEDLLELEDGPPRPHQDTTLPEVQSLRLWRHTGAGVHEVLERRAEPRRRRAREAAVAKAAADARRQWAEAELERKRQEERRRLAEWDAIFAIGAE